MSNQTIDGVPRELLERLLYDLPNERTKGELRALLDEPACPKCNDTGATDSGGVQPWGEGILIPCDCEPAAPHYRR
ncbi:hypothetical protein QGX11_gp116 [Pseudomonas phage PPSC2]|uniref:Uncharacterized protein n=1 Tax=Pseudomonas phage PPSC2 TaxID=2041350 RepID=A0A2R2YB59_9CAUD|nr:hypothetical protein QGX11_gp116 [Pseudomonas phage PPSC2]ATN92879.1 hypothetical protein PPSC2_116 [Pseudomonas phage PPSC2]